MKHIIVNQQLFDGILRANAGCDRHCAILNGALVKLHDGAELYAFVHLPSENGCKMYIADSEWTVEMAREGDSLWIEVTQPKEGKTVCVCRKSESGAVEREPVILCAEQTLISKTLAHEMERHACRGGDVIVISHNKEYTKQERDAFQKRSVLDLNTLDSHGVDILYFDGADKLIEKLLYGGCRELTVFLFDENRAKRIVKMLDRLSHKAPFDNRITVVVGESYAPKKAGELLVGNVNDLPSNCENAVFFALDETDKEGRSVWIGRNTIQWLPSDANETYRVRPYTMHYVTSVMSELILQAITHREAHSRRLFRVNARSLTSETIIKED